VRRHLILVVRTQNAKTGSVGYFFSGSARFFSFCFALAFKAGFRFVIKFIVPLGLSRRFSITRGTFAAFCLASKSVLPLCYRWKGFLFPKFHIPWLFGQGFHSLLGKLQFSLPIVKLGSTVFMANWQRSSSSFWQIKHQAVLFLTTQSR
jgi:hypothetical protein